MDDNTASTDGSIDPYEYAPLRLSSDVDRLTAQARLSVAAEYGGWELAKVRLYARGERQVTLRRRRETRGAQQPGTILPGLSF